jgi:hypothetical protein
MCKSLNGSPPDVGKCRTVRTILRMGYIMNKRKLRLNFDVGRVHIVIGQWSSGIGPMYSQYVKPPSPPPIIVHCKGNSFPWTMRVLWYPKL